MSWFDNIKSYFMPSADNCTKAEDEEAKKHAEYVKKEEDRYKAAIENLKKTKNCKLKYPETQAVAEKKEDDNKPIVQQQQPPFIDTIPDAMEKAIDRVQDGGKRKKSKRNRKNKRKSTKRVR